MKKKWKIIGGIITAFACLLASCNNTSPSSSIDKRLKPNYLLTGTYTDSDNVFDYYDIGNDEYAVSLKSSIKETYQGTGNPKTITIPAVHPVNTTKKVTGIWHNAFHNLTFVL